MFKKKGFSQTSVIMLIAGAAAGLFLLLKPGATLNAVIRISGWALILDGAIKLLQRFLKGKRQKEDFYLPAAEIIGGIAFMAVARFLVRLIPVIVGLVLIGLGIYKGKTALETKKRINGSQWMIMLGLAVASAVIGLYVLFHPNGFTQTVIRILGGYILIECAEDLYAYWLSK